MGIATAFVSCYDSIDQGATGMGRALPGSQRYQAAVDGHCAAISHWFTEKAVCKWRPEPEHALAHGKDSWGLSVSLFCHFASCLQEAFLFPQGGTMKKTTLITLLIFLLLIPATLFLGSQLPGRSYYITSTAIILEMLVPFLLAFEGKKPQARELVTIAVLCALAIVARVAIPIPHIKPMFAVIMLAGIAFGPQSGFMVGAVGAFVSNFFIGHGAYTPWQMLAYGAVRLFRFGFGGWSAAGSFLCILDAAPIYMARRADHFRQRRSHQSGAGRHHLCYDGAVRSCAAGTAGSSENKIRYVKKNRCCKRNTDFLVIKASA